MSLESPKILRNPTVLRVVILENKWNTDHYSHLLGETGFRLPLIH